ncbi:DUF2946 family protein [Solimonas flava]|uniref:DUF2946 family protein n=1 Tax=Solimonas flava TaxID=415849 RepID=UPI0004014339|nr:DUF2946 family protein [Solimonas flava]
MSAIRRHRPLALLLALTALLGQLLLPQLYSGLRAERLADPRLYAFCGVDRATPDARASATRGAARAPAHDGGDCAWCGVLHAVHHATPTVPAFHLPSQRHPVPEVAPLARAPAVRLVHLPQLRGPPFSF